MRVLEGDFELPILSLFQRVQEVFREPSCEPSWGFLKTHVGMVGGLSEEWDQQP